MLESFFGWDEKSKNIYIEEEQLFILHKQFRDTLQEYLKQCKKQFQNFEANFRELQQKVDVLTEEEFQGIQQGGGSKIDYEQCPYKEYPHKCDRKHWCVPPPARPKGTNIGKQDRCQFRSNELEAFFDERPTYRHSKSSQWFDPKKTDMPIAFVPQIPVTSPIPSRKQRPVAPTKPAKQAIRPEPERQRASTPEGKN